MERIERVPADLPLHEQAAIANGQTDRAYALQRERQRIRPAPAGSTGSNVAVCADLNEQVRLWDAAARRPNSPAEQDRIARNRKAVRDQQFRLGC